MTFQAKLAIGLITIITLIFIYNYVISSTPVLNTSPITTNPTQPTPQPTQSTPQSTPQPIIPTQSTPPPIITTVTPTPINVPFCADGIYCNGTGIPSSEAQVGAIVCGANNQQYKCVLNSNGTASWTLLNQSCTDTMKNACIAGATAVSSVVDTITNIASNIISPPTCPNGVYCNGTLVPPSEAGVGAIVCGTNGQYQCVQNANGKASWKSLNTKCTTGMKNDCSIPDIAPWCKAGVYCNGSPVPQSEAQIGAIVCGTNKQKYKCIADGSSAKWSLMNAVCEDNMKNACA